MSPIACSAWMLFFTPLSPNRNTVRSQNPLFLGECLPIDLLVFPFGAGARQSLTIESIHAGGQSIHRRG